MPKLRVLIVDDAVVVRKILAESLSADPDLEVITAANGRIALSKLSQVNPDVVTLDMEMPELDGLGTLKAIRATHPALPVVMFSTLTDRGAAATLDALALGANDYVTKPSNVGSVGAAVAQIKEQLIPKIKALCGRPGAAVSPPPDSGPASGARGPARLMVPPRRSTGARVEIVAIGVSTGGPNALSAVLPALPRDFAVPIVIVQHMPPVFTKLLADRLAGQCAIRVQEGAAGMIVRPGEAVIAPGGLHMTVSRAEGVATIATNTAPPENSCRPAVDALFRSVAGSYGASALGVVLTGMGSDGLRGSEHIREAGGEVLAQDEGSSVVWGMPGFVAKAGLASAVVPLREVAGELVRRVAEGRSTVRRALAS